jgi:hypothetical protein
VSNVELLADAEAPPAANQPPARPRVDVIRSGVLAALGRPAGFLKVSVLPLWGDKFRVNVWAAGESGNAIPNSYFVTADQRGEILDSSPPIQKLS